MFRSFANRVLASLAKRTDYDSSDLETTVDAASPAGGSDPNARNQDANSEDSFTIALDYATSSNNSPRWGNSQATHPELLELLENADRMQQQTMDRIIQVCGLCTRIEEVLEESDPGPRWRNPMSCRSRFLHDWRFSFGQSRPLS